MTSITSHARHGRRPTGRLPRNVGLNDYEDMAPFRLIERDRLTSDETRTLAEGVAEHARQVLEDPGFQPMAILAEDEAGRIVGGISGSTNWTWLSIKLLWVAPSSRGAGLGRRLMMAYEEMGRARGCVNAHVDTLSFQAPGFYEQLGYERFAEIPDYAPGAARIYYRKRL